MTDTIAELPGNDIDWDGLNKLIQVLKPFYETTQLVCPSKSCSLSSALVGILETIDEISLAISLTDENSELYQPLMASYMKLMEYSDYYCTDIYLATIGKQYEYHLKTSHGSCL